MNVIVHALGRAGDIPVYALIKDTQAGTSQDVDLQRLKAYIIRG